MQFREHCATSVKTMFSQSITQIPPFWNDSYTYRCGFLIPTKRFYFHWKRVETGDDILQILKMVENPSNSPDLEKNSSRALSSMEGKTGLLSVWFVPRNGMSSSHWKTYYIIFKSCFESKII